jgi:hypothetical protein
MKNLTAEDAENVRVREEIGNIHREVEEVKKGRGK